MSEWAARRFWTSGGVRPAEGGWEVTLDDRVLRTPGKLPLVLPTRALAEAVAAEWDAQDEKIAPLTMPLTRAANSAVERVAPQRAAVADMLAAYGGTDLLCYRADEAGLAEAQARGWQPWLDWAEARFGAPLAVTQGVLPVAQAPEALAALADAVHALDPWRLTALHDLVMLPGSLVLGLAVLEGRLSAEDAHRLARIDEDWQAARWGRDDEAEAAAEGRRAAMVSAARLRDLLGDRG